MMQCDPLQCSLAELTFRRCLKFKITWRVGPQSLGLLWISVNSLAITMMLTGTCQLHQLPAARRLHVTSLHLQPHSQPKHHVACGKISMRHHLGGLQLHRCSAQVAASPARSGAGAVKAEISYIMIKPDGVRKPLHQLLHIPWPKWAEPGD